MIRGSKEVDSSTNEGSAGDGKISRISSGSSTWLRLKDPRIVRVSRAFGGKDRHSKVCTIRGLKDRRVRLSVPTAIQLYDLQDRLGLNQPSKVVDWLLNAAKHEIDELPPLPVPPGNLGLNHHSMSSSQEVGASRANMVTTNINWEDHREEQPKSNVWSSDSLRRGKSKVVERETINEKEKQDDAGEGHASQDSSINMLPRSHNSSLPRLLNSVVSCGSYFHHLEPSSTFPLSQLGSHGLIPQTEDLQNFSVVPLPSGSQLLVCPPGTTQPLFPTHEIDPRQINHFQMLSSNPHNLFSNSLSPPLHSISQSMRPFHFSMTPRLLPSHNSSGSPSDKDQEFPSK